MKHSTIILLLLFVFTSCGTVRTKPKYLGKDIPLAQSEKGKRAVIRPFLYHDLEFQKISTTLRHNKKFEESILKAFKGTKQFSHITVEHFKSDRIGFERENFEDKVELIKKNLRHFEKTEKADQYFNVYAYTMQRGYHDGQYKTLLGVLHILSLGLIPAYNDESVSLTIEAYDQNGKFLYKKTRENSRVMYAWLPAIFWGGTFGDLNDDKSRDILVDGAIRKIMSEVTSDIKPRK